MVALVSCCIRLGLDNDYADEIKCMQGRLDEAFTVQWGHLKKAGVRMISWLETNAELAYKVIDNTDLDAVMSCRGAFSECGGQLDRVCASSRLGAAMLDYARSTLNNDSFFCFATFRGIFLTRKRPFWEKCITNIFNDCNNGNLLSAGQMGAERSVVDFVSLKTAMK